MANLEQALLFLVSIIITITHCTSTANATIPSTLSSNAPTTSTTTMPTTSMSTISPTTTVFTTTIGPPITAQNQLLVNFSLNYSSYSIPQSFSHIDLALKEAFSICQIPSNYIHNVIQFIQKSETSVPGTYSCAIFSAIDTKDKSQAFQYEEQMIGDPISPFAAALNQTLPAAYFMMSRIIVDVVDVTTSPTTSMPSTSSVPTKTAIPTSLHPTSRPTTSSSSSSGSLSEATKIILWCVGAMVVIIVGGLILIICGRRRSLNAKKRNEISLNVTGMSNKTDEYHTLQDTAEEDLMPKKQIKNIYFSRIDDKDEALINDKGNEVESVGDEEVINEDVENDNHLMEEIPPTFDRI